MNDREQINIVIVGHVDHGKSTMIGRLLADTGSLPEGKLEDVKSLCIRNAKPFEYAFLLDALKDEIPGFQWENCSGGGRIKDYGAMRRAVKKHAAMEARMRPAIQ